MQESALFRELAARPNSETCTDELTALDAIFGEGSISLLALEPAIRYTVSLPADDVLPTRLTFLITLPANYPASKPPQIQLSSSYIGPYAVDFTLYGEILRTYMHEGDGLWTEGEPSVYAGIESAKAKVALWYDAQEARLSGLKLQHELEHPEAPPAAPAESYPEENVEAEQAPMLHSTVKIYSCEPIVDRKSVFIGHCAPLSDPSEVDAVLSAILDSDRKIAKATHNISAWRCRNAANSSLHYSGNDDDGESAAGGRLAHLLEILKVEDVLVVVSRWYGGVHLGADRFKHISSVSWSHYI